MSVWRVDAINPIETFNLPPADKNRGSLGGGGGALFPHQPSVSSSRISIRLPRKTTFGSASLAVRLNRFSAAARLHLQQDGNEPFFIIYLVFYVTSDSIVNTWVKVKINSNYIPVQVNHFK